VCEIASEIVCEIVSEIVSENLCEIVSEIVSEIASENTQYLQVLLNSAQIVNSEKFAPRFQRKINNAIDELRKLIVCEFAIVFEF
jgi:hypothetical protein